MKKFEIKQSPTEPKSYLTLAKNFGIGMLKGSAAAGLWTASAATGGLCIMGLMIGGGVGGWMLGASSNAISAGCFAFIGGVGGVLCFYWRGRRLIHWMCRCNDHAHHRRGWS